MAMLDVLTLKAQRENVLSEDIKYQEILRRAAVSLEIILSDFSVKTPGKFLQAFYNEMDDRSTDEAFDRLSDEIKHQWYSFVDALDEAYNLLDPTNEAWFEFIEDFVSDAFAKLKTFDEAN